MSELNPKSFSTFGALLRHLRLGAQLTQEALGMAVGYSRAHIARLEGNQRTPDVPIVKSRFLAALDLDPESAVALRFIELAGLTPALDPASSPDSASPYPNNLPHQLTSFIGREEALAQLSGQLANARLLTLTGTGGVGKTRLAIQFAATQLQNFPDGIWLVELAPILDPAAVPNAVAYVLRLGASLPADPYPVLIDFLQDKHALLILDNCEHVLEACARFIDAILHQCGHIQILATSREVLGIVGEHIWRVPSLQLITGTSTPLAELARCESVRLFLDRTKAVLPSFGLTESNAPDIQQICVHLDGIPLAIELAAARIASMSPQQLAKRLSDRFSLLTSGNRSALPRHQTLQAMIEWSYRLMSEAERSTFRKLATFIGGWTLEAAESVCAEPNTHAGAVLNQLNALLDKSLICVDDSGAEQRYAFLETIREYAAERLRESHKDIDTRNRHLEYFLDYGRRIAHTLNLDHANDQVRLIQRLDQDMANIKQAFDWAIQNHRTADGYALLGYFYVLFIARMGRGPEFLSLYSALLAHPTNTQHTYVNGMVHLELGDLHLHFGNLDQIKEHYEQAQAIGQTLDNADILLRVEFGLAWYAILCNNSSEARLHYGAWKQILQRGVSLSTEEISDSELSFLYELADLEGDYATERAIAARCYEQSHKSLTKMQTSANARMFGYALIHTGEFDLARERLRESLLDNHDLGDKQAVAACLGAFANLALAQCALIKAARLYGASEALQKSIHVNLVYWDRRRVEHDLHKLQQQLDAPTLNATWAEGKALSIDQAIAYALAPISAPQ